MLMRCRRWLLGEGIGGVLVSFFLGRGQGGCVNYSTDASV